MATFVSISWTSMSFISILRQRDRAHGHVPSTTQQVLNDHLMGSPSNFEMCALTSPSTAYIFGPIHIWDMWWCQFVSPANLTHQDYKNEHTPCRCTYTYIYTYICIHIYIYISQECPLGPSPQGPRGAHKGPTHKGPKWAHKGPAHKGPGSRQGPGPQGPRCVLKRLTHKGPGEPTRARPTRAQEKPTRAQPTKTQKGPAPKGPWGPTRAQPTRVQRVCYETRVSVKRLPGG